MKYRLLYSIVFALLLCACDKTISPQGKIIIDLQKIGAEVAPSMYGIFFEEINHAGDGGLYAELVKNRSFEELEMPEGYYTEGNTLYPKKVHNHLTGEIKSEHYRWTTEVVPGWSLKTREGSAAEMKLTKERPKYSSAPNNLKVTIKNASHPVWLINEGYWGMNLVEGENYFLRTIIRSDADYKGQITAHLLSEDDKVLTSTTIQMPQSNSWYDISQLITSSATDAKGKLALEFNTTGTVYLDYISLFPEKTFNNRPNGLRNDVANALVDLLPAFVRWPGGCVVEGITLNNRFEWKKTLGDPAARSGEYSTWGYRCSYGFGYYEMLQFCEDINADAMYVCNVGLGCQFCMGDASPDNQIAYYLDDCMDAIEYALGDTTTEWGAKRVEHGHPDPFPLKYVEIGNENWGDEYDKRFDIFYAAIKEKYPELVLISNHGLERTGKIAKTDMVDPHWYVAPNFFFQNSTIFDNHPRGKYDVYVGEYACNSGVGAGNMLAALSEAAFITGMERNGDLVKMTSYAPLLENRNDRSWAVNLIWLDTDQVVGRSSYYVQKMAAEHRPTYNVASNMTMSTPQPMEYINGKVGLGSWETQVEFKDIYVIKEDGVKQKLTISSSSENRGTWDIKDEVLSQTSSQSATQYIIDGFNSNQFTLTCKARRTSGNEGFFIYIGLTEDGNKGFVYNIAGWTNQTTAVEQVSGGRNAGVASVSVPQTIETDKWYEIKLVVTPQKSELYMDGEYILSHVPESTPLQFISSGYDEATHELILKVVNAEATPYSTTIKLDGVSHVEKEGKVISLSATNGEEENSFEEPQKIYPKESVYNKFGKNFNYAFPPFSYTILRIKTK
ncbi:alpha-L-arabinofuranosidase C-terminal domain-containing protein [Bacteroides sp. 51]|uniref:alpha-L-arabinofuranosidase C-terminal domain-containing protein n=1 Tax=Bacteroides sp. 51 TaxID=2302938 RepID=UPI0013D820F0|nr:alpha-L-arabinofuranosidase C-terminal domain-containing protein [Bacteroides sp. 51]NDV80890.1 alpha-L-arabinofuranosidase [Bacteroides sp. 51]